MKKINFDKFKKISMIEIISFLIILGAILIYISPNFLSKKEDLKLQKMKSDSDIFTAKVLEHYSKNPNLLASDISKLAFDELNSDMKNPFDKKLNAYTYELNCKNCNSVEFNNKLKTITITTFDKEGEMIKRTVVVPPSFVKYEKENEISKKNIKKKKIKK